MIITPTPIHNLSSACNRYIFLNYHYIPKSRGLSNKNLMKKEKNVDEEKE